MLVPTRTWARVVRLSPLAEHRVEDVAELGVAPSSRLGAGSAVSATRPTFRVVAVRPPWSLLLPGCVDLAAIELSPLLGIRQNRIGAGNSLESLFGLGVSGVEIRVVPLGQFSICIPDGVLARVTRHAERRVWVRQFALRSSKCSATCSRRTHAAFALKGGASFKCRCAAIHGWPT